MSLLRTCSFSCTLYIASSLLWISSRQVAAQESNVYVYADDPRFTLTGNWTLLDAVGGFSGHWLFATYASDSDTPPSLSFSFDGTAFVAFGTVVNGTTGQSLNISAKIDAEDPISSFYNPTSGLSDGVDPNYQIFTRGPLPAQIHTFVLEITGETSPFLLQGVVYTPTNVSQTLLPSTTLSPETGPSQEQASPSSSNDAAKLGGAIGGGLGALLLVGLIILFMMRRIRRIEKDEKKLLARPFITETTSRTSRGASRTGAYTSSTPPTIGGTSSRLKQLPPTSVPSSEAPLKRPLPSSSNSHSTPSSQVYSPPDNSATPLRSPVASLISVPSEFHATTVGVPPGTAVASSYIGPSPLPPEDTPPVPPIPEDVKRKSKSGKRTKEPLGPNSGLGLFSNDSSNSIGTNGSLSRPLPIVPGTRSSTPAYNFPPEKVGLSPPPARSRQNTKISPDEKRLLPNSS